MVEQVLREDIQKILEVSVNAPSGSNSQPWRFEVRGNVIDVIAEPEKDHPILNFRYRGTWVAHGALIENMAIASSALGYKATIDIFSDDNNPNLTARIKLERSTPAREPLYPAIDRRATNRKPYKITPLTAEQKSALSAASSRIPGITVKFTENREKIKILGEAVSMNEVVMLENKLLHKLFFDEIVWTREEERKRMAGLYLKTMELKPPQEKALRIFRYWPVMNLLSKLGLARAIAKDNAKNYAATPFMGVIVVPDNDKDFITAGRIMERMWLEATRLGLSFHLITGVMFFWQKINAGETKEFSEKHLELIRNAYERIASVFGITGGIAALLFRAGDGGEPSARSAKNLPIVSYV